VAARGERLILLLLVEAVVNALKITTDQKVRGSSPFGRAGLYQRKLVV